MAPNREPSSADRSQTPSQNEKSERRCVTRETEIEASLSAGTSKQSPLTTRDWNERYARRVDTSVFNTPTTQCPLKMWHRLNGITPCWSRCKSRSTRRTHERNPRGWRSDVIGPRGLRAAEGGFVSSAPTRTGTYTAHITRSSAVSVGGLETVDSGCTLSASRFLDCLKT